ncbi:MAG: WD40/YVTN/BNR-like repeat-containing protein [Terriglobales bacterium]
MARLTPLRGSRCAGALLLCLALGLALVAGQATSRTVLPAPVSASLRGLCVVNPRVVWASGTGGVWLRTVDAGAHWTAGVVPGAERLDFRDVKAFSGQLAYLMAVGAAGGIFKTTDGGASWRRLYANSDPGFFLDALAFWDPNHGLALGDPLQGRFLLLRTSDGGATWQPAVAMPPALPGEGAFAASGTALVLARRHRRRAWFATGGHWGARVFRSTNAGRSWIATPTPMTDPEGGAGAGIFSLAFWDLRHGVAVGGDYTRPQATTRTVALSDDGGVTWRLASGAPPRGYRSAIAIAPGSASRPPVLVAVGPTGADLSRDGGNSWASISSQPLNSVAFAAYATGWAVGPRGIVVRFTVPPPPHP